MQDSSWTRANQPYLIMGMRAGSLVTLFLLFMAFIFLQGLISGGLLIFYCLSLFIAKKFAIIPYQIPRYLFNRYVIGLERKGRWVGDQRVYIDPIKWEKIQRKQQEKAKKALAKAKTKDTP